jgi:hypothetical protein
LVNVVIRGPGSDATEVAEFSGDLSRMGDVEFSREMAEILESALVERAVTFIVGDSTFELLSSRFVSSKPLEYRSEWLEVRTRDATIWIGPKRPAWSD